MIGRHHVGTCQRTAIGRHLRISGSRHAPYRRRRGKQQREHDQDNHGRRERGVGAVLDKQIDAGAAHKAAPLSAGTETPTARRNAV